MTTISIKLLQTTQSEFLEKTKSEDEQYEFIDFENRMNEMFEMKILRLDGYNIVNIDNLELFSNLKELYLQHNAIEIMDNLDFLFKLEILILSYNKIRKIENISNLKALQLIDLSNNLIDEVEVSNFPKTIYMIDLRENPCIKTPNYKKKLIEGLPELIKLDREEIEREDEEEDEEDEEEDDINIPIKNINKNFGNIENTDLTKVDTEDLINSVFDDTEKNCHTDFSSRLSKLKERHNQVMKNNNNYVKSLITQYNEDVKKNREKEKKAKK